MPDSETTIASAPATTADPSRYLTRKFALVAGLIVLVAGATLAFIQYRFFEEQVHLLAERDHAAISRIIANGLWELGERTSAATATLSTEKAPLHPAYRELDAEVRRLIAGTSVVKVKIIDGDGRVAYSTDWDDLGKSYAGNAAFQEALFGTAAGDYGWRPVFDSANGVLENVWIVSNYIPKLSETGRPAEVVAEVYSDISSRRALIQEAAMQGTAIAVIILLVVYVLLLAVVYAAVRMVRGEHARAVSLAAAMARVEAASQAKTTFLANMSHELRTPLNAIIGFSEIMSSELKGPLGDASYKSYVSDISKSGRHLLDIIDRVLDLVRTETGSVLIDVAPTNVAFIAKSVGRMVSKEAESGSLNLRIVADEDPLIIDTDGAKLREILIGIISNSIKFTPAGGRIVVRVGRDEDGEGAVISVTDTGIGMRTEDVPAATAPFGHVEGVYAKSRGGVGLGLPLTRKLTELLEGSFALTSTQGKGTTVTITLPQRPSNLPANDTDDPSGTATADTAAQVH